MSLNNNESRANNSARAREINFHLFISSKVDDIPMMIGSEEVGMDDAVRCQELNVLCIRFIAKVMLSVPNGVVEKSTLVFVSDRINHLERVLDRLHNTVLLLF